MKKVKGILINSETKEIREIELEPTYSALYSIVGCELIQPIQFDEGHDIHLDEEGFFRKPKGYFLCKGQLLAGSGVILGITEEGDLKSHSLSVESVAKSIRFLDRQAAYAYALKIDKRNAEALKNQPNVIYCAKLADLIPSEE